MGLLSKALEITWGADDLDGVMPFEGGMHLLMSFLSGIGVLYGGARLEALLHESEVFAPATAHHLFTGKHFDRGLYALKLVDEVLSSRFYLQFQIWCEERDIPIPPEMATYLDEFINLISAEDWANLPVVL